MHSLRSIATAAVAVVLTAGLGQAATSWTPASGSTDNFTFTSGQTENGLFTDDAPDVFQDSLLFFPNNFTADDENGYVEDTLSFVLTANPGSHLGRISAKLTGDFDSEGYFPMFAGGTLTLTNMATSAVISQAFTFTPTGPYMSGGQFTGIAEITNLPSDWVTVLVKLDANLSALGAGGDSLVPNGVGAIQLKGTTIDLQAAAVPLPGALLAAPGAMAIAWFARRKMMKR